MISHAGQSRHLFVRDSHNPHTPVTGNWNPRTKASHAASHGSHAQVSHAHPLPFREGA